MLSLLKTRRPAPEPAPKSLPDQAPPAMKATGPVSRLLDRFASRLGGAPVLEAQSRAGGRLISMLAFQPLAGGSGTTTLAVNYASAIATANPGLRVLLLDLNLQFGGVGLHLNLPETLKIVDAYARLGSLDHDGFRACLQKSSDNLSVFTAPAEVLPLDAVNPTHLRHLISLARANSDVLVMDLPLAVTDWSAEIWKRADYLALNGTLDVRSAAGLRRLSDLAGRDLLQSAHCHILLNRVAGRRSSSWQEEYQAFTRPLARKAPKLMPEGGPGVTAALAAGQSLPRFQPQNPLAETILREISLLNFTNPGGAARPAPSGKSA